MSLELELEELLTEEVTVQPFLSEPASDGSARYDEASPRIFKARVEQFARMVRDRNGKEIVSNTMAILAPTPDSGAAHRPTANDLFVLPAIYYPQQQPPCISVRPVNDEAGELHHWEVFL